MLVRPVMKRLLFPWKTKEKKARFARAPHDEEAFLPEGKKGLRSLRSLGLASLLTIFIVAPNFA